MKVLVTGANGFLGRHVCSTLEAQGIKVIRAVRKNYGLDSELLIPSIDGDVDWTDHLKQVDAVIHTAAKVHIENYNENEADEFFEINKRGTLKLAKDCAKSGVKTFIFLSTIGVNGEYSSDVFRVTDKVQPTGAYAKSKHEAEIELLSRWGAAESPMRVVILRPPLIYGKDAPGNFAKLTGLLRKQLLLPLGSIKNRRSFINVENLSSFICFCLFQKKVRGCFLVADNEVISTSHFIREMNQNLGGPSKIISFPVWILTFFLKLVGKSKPLKKLTVDLEINIQPIKELGWRPPYNFSEAMKRSFLMSSEDHNNFNG